MPDGVDWWHHRVASSKFYSAGLHEIMWGWTLYDVQSAHLVLDAIADASGGDSDD